jgi:hypothetical protein
MRRHLPRLPASFSFFLSLSICFPNIRPPTLSLLLSVRYPPRLIMGAAQSTLQQRSPTGIPGMVYEKAALQAELERDSERFKGYPCVCRKTYIPPVPTQQLPENGAGMEIRKGQEAVVLGVSGVMLLDLCQDYHTLTRTWNRLDWHERLGSSRGSQDWNISSMADLGVAYNGYISTTLLNVNIYFKISDS